MAAMLVAALASVLVIAGDARTAHADGSPAVGLPTDVMLFQKDPLVNGTTIPHDLYHCPNTPIGAMTTDGSRVATAGPGSSCVAVDGLVINLQRTAMVGLVGSGLWLYNVQPNGTVSQSPYQLWGAANPRCSEGENLAWAPDGVTITCFRTSDRLNWQNTATGATGYVSGTALGLPANARVEPVWLENGDLMVFGEVSGCWGTTQWLIPMNGLTPEGPAQRIGALCPSEVRNDVVLSADGSKLAYTAYGENSVNARIEIADADGSNPRALRPLSAASGYFHDLVWSPDGRHLLATSSVVVNGVARRGVAAVDVNTGEAHWVLPPQADFDALAPTAANVPVETPSAVRMASRARITAVNGDPLVTAAHAGDTLTITGSGYSAGNPPTTFTVCDQLGTTCIALPVEHVTIDALGNLTCTVSLPTTWTPPGVGGGTTGTPGGNTPVGSVTFPAGPSAPAPKPTSRVFLSPSTGNGGEVIQVGVDYLGANQTVTIAAFSSADASGTALPGSVSARASACGCVVATFTVPSGTRTVAAVDAATGVVIAYAHWTLADTQPPTVVSTPDRLADGADGWYHAPVTLTWAASDDQTPSEALNQPTPTVASTEGASVTYTSEQVCDLAGNCASGSSQVSLDLTAPTVTASVAPPAADVWHSGPVTVSFSCDDSLSGIATCSEPATLTGDGAGQTVTGEAADLAGNTATVTTVLNIDATAPSIGIADLSAHTITTAGLLGVTTEVSDATSGVASATLWIDDKQAPSSALTVHDGVASGTVANLTAGVHELGISVTDVAGNIASATLGTVVVVDPSVGPALGAGWLVPGGSSSDPGDLLPNLNGRSRMAFAFAAGYTRADSPTSAGAFAVNYAAGGLHLTGTNVGWILAATDGAVTIYGEARASLGGPTYPVVFKVWDSNTWRVPDHVMVKVFAPGSDPLTSPALYQASGDVQGGLVEVLP